MAEKARVPPTTLSLRPESTLLLASVSMAETACVPLLTLLALLPEFAQSWLFVLLILLVVLFFFFSLFLHDAHDAMDILLAFFLL
jgi:hypothetical protein